MKSGIVVADVRTYRTSDNKWMAYSRNLQARAHRCAARMLSHLGACLAGSMKYSRTLGELRAVPHKILVEARQAQGPCL